MQDVLPSSTAQAAIDGIPQGVISSLSAHINSCFHESLTHKSVIIERLLACERQRRGEYAPALKAQIAASGGQEIFMMMTDIKCRAADSWIKDVMQNHSESTWALNPTQEPDLPDNLKQEVEEILQEEAKAVAAMGIPIDPATLEERRREITDEATTRVAEIARDRADKMEARIADKLSEGGWKAALASLIYDFTTYPACFMKGPILRKEKTMKWGPDMKPLVQETVVINIDRISPWDIFQSPSAVTMQDGYLIQRHRLTRKAIKQMEGLPGSSKGSIQSVLQTYRLGLKTQINGDNEHEYLNGRTMTWSADGLIETLEYWGPASGMMLKEWGMKTLPNGGEVDEFEEYQVNAWKVGGYVIRVQINPDPLDQRPYSKACFEDIPGAFWGKALPEMMADVQIMSNAAMRALAANMGIASGPQVEVSVDRLAPGEVVTSMYPWKIWQTTSDRTGNGQPAVRFFQPEMNSGELLANYSFFSKQADEVTGVPNYIYGSGNVAGAGRTSSGLAMLMENAAKGIKHAILGLDAATSEIIVRIYNHLMMFDPDESIKGDMNIIAAGAIGQMIREQQNDARKEFMAATLNPIDAPIIGQEGRAYMLRETAKGLFTDINKIIPDPDKMKLMAQSQQALSAQQAQQGVAPGQPGPQAPVNPQGPVQPLAGTPPQQMPASPQ